MAVDPVPWMIGGGAEHSPSVARSIAYAATGGGGGIVSSEDLGVRAMATPGTQVRVAPGLAAIPNTYPNQRAQSYIGRVVTETALTITATGGTARSDMIVARIDDPEFGGTVPSNPKVGPYFHLDVISNVGSGAVAIPASYPHPAIPLARVDLPVNTGTVTQAMLKDLRKMGQRWTERHLVLPGDRAGYLGATSVAGALWPFAARTLDVPLRATKLRLIATVANFRIAAPSYGVAWLKFADQTGTNSGFDTADAAAGVLRNTMVNAQTFNIPASMRGTTQPLEMRARLLNSSAPTQTSRPGSDATTEIILDVEWSEEPSLL